MSRDLHFFVPSNPSDDGAEQLVERATLLQVIVKAYTDSTRDAAPEDSEWVDNLDGYLQHCVQSRIEYVQHWLNINTSRFQTDITTFQGLRREFEALVVTLKASVQLCKLQCGRCQLFCLKGRHHEGVHDCGTSHVCTRRCEFLDEHPGDGAACGLPCVLLQSYPPLRK